MSRAVGDDDWPNDTDGNGHQTKEKEVDAPWVNGLDVKNAKRSKCVQNLGRAVHEEPLHVRSALWHASTTLRDLRSPHDE